MIYSPAEDSYLMQEVLKQRLKNKKIKFLEIGIGSGIQLMTAKDSGIELKNILGVDINPEAVTYCKNLGFKAIKSDLFEKVKGKYNIIIFNPPYLPEDLQEDKKSRTATTGGKQGSEVINKFLRQAKKHLEKDGKIFLLTSSLTKGIKWGRWKKKKILETKIFFEKLFVFEVK